jgi:citrate lyase beta subunit
MESEPRTSSPRRSFLYVPGDSLRKLAKAAALAADVLILDLEDGVAPTQKEAARATTGAALQQLDFGARERLVRLNPASLGMQPQEIAATLPGRPDGYVVPKVERAADLVEVDAALTAAEAELGLSLGAACLFAMVETAAGLLNLPAIAAATPRLAGLIFGAEDFTANVGAERTAAGLELLYARSAIVTAAAACGLQAVDAVYLDLDDPAGLAEECSLARRLGFTGKTAVHPRQLATVNQTFTPSPAAVERAQRLVAAFAAHEAAGAGVFVFEGKAVDRPVILAAQRLLARQAQIEAAQG